jgi:hypothetical protein
MPARLRLLIPLALATALLAFSSTATADWVTSGPIPSPSSTNTFYVVIFILER